MGARRDNSGELTGGTEVMLSNSEQEQLYGPANPPVNQYLIS